MILQFLAEPTELATWVMSWKVERHLLMVVERRGVGVFEEASDVNATDLAESIRALVLSPFPMTVNVPAHQFIEHNDDFLRVTTGIRTADTLQEAAIQTTASTPDVERTWKSIMRRTKKSMRRGRR